jgi:hypothetical protein
MTRRAMSARPYLENLIEREFIERDRNDRKLYIYLA